MGSNTTHTDQLTLKKNRRVYALLNEMNSTLSLRSRLYTSVCLVSHSSYHTKRTDSCREELRNERKKEVQEVGRRDNRTRRPQTYKYPFPSGFFFERTVPKLYSAHKLVWMCLANPHKPLTACVCQCMCTCLCVVRVYGYVCMCIMYSCNVCL